MTKRNYQEMRSEKGATEVFVPLFNKTWTLPLYATFHTVIATDTPSCFVMNPHSSGSSWFKLQHGDVIHQIYIFKYDIMATVTNSAEYRIKCSGMNWDEPSQKTSKIEIIKSLKITFFQGIIQKCINDYTRTCTHMHSHTRTHAHVHAHTHTQVPK